MPYSKEGPLSSMIWSRTIPVKKALSHGVLLCLTTWCALTWATLGLKNRGPVIGLYLHPVIMASAPTVNRQANREVQNFI